MKLKKVLLSIIFFVYGYVHGMESDNEHKSCAEHDKMLHQQITQGIVRDLRKPKSSIYSTQDHTTYGTTSYFKDLAESYPDSDDEEDTNCCSFFCCK